MSTAVPPPPPPTASAAAPGAYPITLELDADLVIARWRPLVHWILVIPQLIVLYLVQIVAGVLWLVSFFTVLFTKRNPFVGVQALLLRYTWRVVSYAHFMREAYPPWEFDTVLDDPGTDPARVTVQDPGEMNRWLVLVKWLLLIPHYFVLFFLWIAAFFVAIVAFFAVIITGAWPESLREFVIGVMRWTTRVNAYHLFITDVYPSFTLH
jgi:Domain of unknown function (DUF4389)